MKLFKLDSSFLPSTSLDDFTTLVWTERYVTAGDFQLVVEDNPSFLKILPVGTLISHTDTKEVMIVENHEIKRDEKKKLTVTATGRTFETFSECRVTPISKEKLYNSDGSANVEIITDSAENVAVTLLQAALTTSGGSQVVGLQIVAVIRDPDTSLDHSIQRGDTYGRVLDLLNISSAGIRTLRGYPGTNLTIMVHDGLDHRNSVVFQVDDLQEPTYLWTNKNFRTHAHVAAHDYARFYQSRDVSGTPTGLARRTMYVEASEIEGDYTPGTATDVISATGQYALDGHTYQVLTSAKIAETAVPKYKIHYDMGDLVTTYGEFAPAQSMRVTEHILTVDKDGQRGYPSLSAV